MMSGHGPNQSPNCLRSPPHWVAYRRSSISSEYDSSDFSPPPTSSIFDRPEFSPPQSPQLLPALRNNTKRKSFLSNDRDSNLRRYRHSSGNLRQESLQQRQHHLTEQTRSQENLLRQEITSFLPRSLNDLMRLHGRRNAVYEKINPETYDFELAEMQDFMTRLGIDTPPEDILQEAYTSMEEDIQVDPVPNVDTKRKRDDSGDEQSSFDEKLKRARRSISCPPKKEDSEPRPTQAPYSKRKRGMDDDRQPISKRAKGRSASLNRFQDPKRKRDNEQDEEVFSPKRAKVGKMRGKGHNL